MLPSRPDAVRVGPLSQRLRPYPRNKSARRRDVEDVDNVPQFFKREVEHFFAVYKELEDKKVRIGGWQSAAEAWVRIEAATG